MRIELTIAQRLIITLMSQLAHRSFLLSGPTSAKIPTLPTLTREDLASLRTGFSVLRRCPIRSPFPPSQETDPHRSIAARSERAVSSHRLRETLATKTSTSTTTATIRPRHTTRQRMDMVGIKRASSSSNSLLNHRRPSRLTPSKAACLRASAYPTIRTTSQASNQSPSKSLSARQ